MPLIASIPGGGLVIFISGTVFDVNLYARAGAPPEALNITFVFDDATVGSTDSGVPAIRAGAFDPATTIKLIFTNGSQISAIGGNGGDAYVQNDSEFTLAQDATTTDATDGGDIYQSDDIATEIYINYGVVDTYVTDCDMFAAGGGGAAASLSPFIENSWFDPAEKFVRAPMGAAASGGGGSGIPGGNAGIATKSASSLGDGKTVILNGNNGVFASGGLGASPQAYNLKNGLFGQNAEGTANSTSSAGGTSIDAIVSTRLTTPIQGYVGGSINSIGAPGLAGGAIKGLNVTVYNLLADATRFRDGNSDAYTLITV